MDTQESPNLSIGHNLKIALFHLGSGMSDILATGIWNRIMISDLGYSATTVSLLVGLRYFLAPLGVWAGRVSDERAIGGYRRLFWVWSGRAMMVISMIVLGIVTASLARGTEATAGVWLILSLALLLFSLGNALSGSTFLALIYDRAAPNQRGRAVGIVWTFLLLGFSVGGVAFGLMLPSTGTGRGYTPEALQNLFIAGALIMGGLWLVSLLGEERRTKTVVAPKSGEKATSFRGDLKLAWENHSTRLFFWYLSLSMIFAFMQDPVLEPFAGDVFKMDAAHTTRFAGYWGSMAILGTVVFLFLSRRYKRLNNTFMSYIGVALLALTFVVFGLSSIGEIRGLVTPGLILLGLGLGVWNVGTLGLMMEMSPFGRAGTFLGFWTLVSTLGRGLGVFGGGVIRDLTLQATGSLTLAYGAVFVVEAVMLVVAFAVLTRIKADAFQSEPQPADSIFAGAME